MLYTKYITLFFFKLITEISFNIYFFIYYKNNSNKYIKYHKYVNLLVLLVNILFLV